MSGNCTMGGSRQKCRSSRTQAGTHSWAVRRLCSSRVADGGRYAAVPNLSAIYHSLLAANLIGCGELASDFTISKSG